MHAVGCPLLLFWPLVCEVRGTRSARSVGGEESEDAVMEMRLRENPQKFSSALLQLTARYLFVNGAQVGSNYPLSKNKSCTHMNTCSHVKTCPGFPL